MMTMRTGVMFPFGAQGIRALNNGRFVTALERVQHSRIVKRPKAQHPRPAVTNVEPGVPQKQLQDAYHALEKFGAAAYALADSGVALGDDRLLSTDSRINCPSEGTVPGGLCKVAKILSAGRPAFARWAGLTVRFDPSVNYNATGTFSLNGGAGPFGNGGLGDSFGMLGRVTRAAARRAVRSSGGGGGRYASRSRSRRAPAAPVVSTAPTGPTITNPATAAMADSPLMAAIQVLLSATAPPAQKQAAIQQMVSLLVPPNPSQPLPSPPTQQAAITSLQQTVASPTVAPTVAQMATQALQIISGSGMLAPGIKPYDPAAGAVGAQPQPVPAIQHPPLCPPGYTFDGPSQTCKRPYAQATDTGGYKTSCSNAKGETGDWKDGSFHCWTCPPGSKYADNYVCTYPDMPAQNVGMPATCPPNYVMGPDGQTCQPVQVMSPGGMVSATGYGTGYPPTGYPQAGGYPGAGGGVQGGCPPGMQIGPDGMSCVPAGMGQQPYGASPYGASPYSPQITQQYPQYPPAQTQYQYPPPGGTPPAGGGGGGGSDEDEDDSGDDMNGVGALGRFLIF